MNIHVGDEIELTEEVVPENTAEKWGSGSLPVYATPAMISLIEQSACLPQTLLERVRQTGI